MKDWQFNLVLGLLLLVAVFAVAIGLAYALALILSAGSVLSVLQFLVGFASGWAGLILFEINRR